MKISTKARYGLRALVDLAAYSTGEYISLSSIAERQNVSQGYLGQIFLILVRSKLVEGARGLEGGYILKENVRKMSVGEILSILEGNPILTVKDASSNEFEHFLKDKIWDRIDEKINEVVSSLTLEDIALQYKMMNNIKE